MQLVQIVKSDDAMMNRVESKRIRENRARS